MFVPMGIPATSYQGRVHELLRTSVLDAAWEATVADDWASVRIADIAERVGVSRQTIYNEFGNKHDLAMAVFEREIVRIGEAVRVKVAESSSFRDAVRNAITWMLDDAEEHPLLARVIASARAGEPESLLPMLTVRAELTINPLREVIADCFHQRWSGGDFQAACRVAELVIRQCLSWIVMPSDMPRDLYVDAVVEMTVSHAHMASIVPTSAP